MTCLDRREADLWKILTHYGAGAQRLKALEELGELHAALARIHLGEGEGSAHYENLAEEIADCGVMLRQIMFAWAIPEEKIDALIEYKLDRQLMRINAEEKR